MNQRGFTLVEMLISLGIFAIITGFVMANFRAGSQGDELRLAQQLVASELRRTQTMALAGQTTYYCAAGVKVGHFCPTGNAAECGGEDANCVKGVPPGGYCVHLKALEPDNRTLILFADLDAGRNHRYDAGEEIRTMSVSPGTFVSVTQTDPSDAGGLDVCFTPGDAMPLFNGASAPVVAKITVKHRTTEAIRTVTINAVSGQISAN